MIQPNILKELTDCIHKYSSYVTANMTKIDITLFLLGDKFKIKNKKSDKKGIVYLSPDSIRNLYAGKCSLSQEALGLLICPKSRSLKHLFYLGLTLNDRHMRQLTQEIQQIYTKYFPDSSNNLDFNTMVSSLVYQHFLGTDMVEDLFFPFDRKRKLETCSSYIPWIEKEEELYQLIKNIDSESSCSNQHGNSGDNLVFLTG